MQLSLMWDLQELDCSIAALSGEIEKLPLRRTVQETEDELETLKASLALEEGSLQEQRKRLKGLEMTIMKLSADREALRRKLYGGEVGNVRELEQMEKKLELLEKDKNSREEEALVLMESVEELEMKSGDLSRRIGDLDLAAAEQQRQLKTEISRQQEELAQLQEKREALETKLEPQYLERYRTMSQRHHGRGLALVEGDICGGCRVYISSKQQGLLYNPGLMVYCENCGRLLVKIEQA